MTNRHLPERRVVFATKWPLSSRRSGIAWTEPPGGTDDPLADAIGSSVPAAWKNVKCTVLFPAEPGSTYVCTLFPPGSAIVYRVGSPEAAVVWIRSDGSLGVRRSGTVTDPVDCCTRTSTFQVPNMERVVAWAVQVPDPDRRNGTVGFPTFGADGRDKLNETELAGAGRPVSKSVTLASKRFGPTVPGVSVSRTFTVVAKPEPATTICGGPTARRAGEARDEAGGKLESTPVDTRMAAAITISAVTVRRSAPIRLG